MVMCNNIICDDKEASDEKTQFGVNASKKDEIFYKFCRV